MDRFEIEEKKISRENKMNVYLYKLRKSSIKCHHSPNSGFPNINKQKQNNMNGKKKKRNSIILMRYLSESNIILINFLGIYVIIVIITLK